MVGTGTVCVDWGRIGGGVVVMVGGGVQGMVPVGKLHVAQCSRTGPELETAATAAACCVQRQQHPGQQLLGVHEATWR